MRISAWLAALLMALSSLADAGSPQQALETALAQWVASQNDAQPEQVKMAPLDPRIQVQPCASSFNFDYPFVNRENVRVRCSKPAWQIFVKVGFSQQQPSATMLVVSRDISAGHVLTESDLEAKPVAVASPGTVSEQASVVGRQLRRALNKGQPVLAQDLEKNTKALRARVALKAGDMLTESAIERVDLPGGANGTALWIPNELTPGTRVARPVPAGQVLQTADIAESRQVVIATANLTPGQSLKPEMLKLDRIDAEKITRTHLFDLSGLDSYEIMRPIRAGEAVRTSDLRPALMVKKGDQISFVMGRPPEFMISVKLEALQDGRLNDQIKLRNPESGHILSGIVTGKGAAKGL